MGEFLRHFHVRKGVAPLKQPLNAVDSCVQPNFHVRKGVAPLKQKFGTPGLKAKIEFPRPQGRGPIEAAIRLVLGRSR